MQPDLATATPLDKAILVTLLYADVFSFPMTTREIHHFLIGLSTTLEEVRTSLTHPFPAIAPYIEIGTLQNQPIYGIARPPSEKNGLFEKRQQREIASAQLWPKARRYGILLGHLPFVRMVALTGALAVRNVGSPDDDLDYILVVKTGRVWLARLGAVILVRICKIFGVTLCPNYVLAEAALEQDKHDLFMAHELTQMIPLTGQAVYQKMRQANQWVDEMLPNAQAPFYPEKDGMPRWIGRWVQAIFEWSLSGPLGNRLENWERSRKIRKLEKQAIQSTDTVLDDQHVKGHFFDYGSRTLQRFYERLAAYGLEVAPDEEWQINVFSPAAD
jgi:hypothetical protein